MKIIPPVFNQVNLTQKIYRFTAILYFHNYPHGRNITVYSDHKPLEKVLDNHYIHGKLSRWKMILASYDITIRYRPGKSNQNADTLSRIPVESGEKIDYAIREHNNERYFVKKNLLLHKIKTVIVFIRSLQNLLSRKIITYKEKLGYRQQ
jgi:hypothetical protein